MNESEVDIEKNYQMAIMCWDQKGNKRVIWMIVSKLIQTFMWLNKRTIYFHTYDINIRDENYFKYLSWALNTFAIISKKRFLIFYYKKDAIWLWKQITHIKYEIRNFNLRIKGMPSQTYEATKASISPIYTLTQFFVPYVDQPHENDDLWLLKEYLNKFYS